VTAVASRLRVLKCPSLGPNKCNIVVPFGQAHLQNWLLQTHSRRHTMYMHHFRFGTVTKTRAQNEWILLLQVKVAWVPIWFWKGVSLHRSLGLGKGVPYRTCVLFPFISCCLVSAIGEESTKVDPYI